MKRFAIASLVSLFATSLVSPLPGLAAGIIAIDPVGGVMPRPVIVPPRVRPMPRAHIGPAPSPARPLLKGSVSMGVHLQAESVKVEIADQVAKTYITQTFVNDTDRQLAGTYLFPLPEDTTFSSFSLHIDGKPVEGKILEADEARAQYEEIVRRMVDPGLLEYADYKTVRARIFPIPAHGTKKVELEYTQVLRAENGLLKYRFPLKTEGETVPADEVKVDVKLSSKQDLRTIWSPSHIISANKASEHQAKISYAAHDALPDKDFLLYFSVSDKELAANVLTHKAGQDDGYFLLTLAPPMDTKQVLGKDIVLVADTSGSMQGQKMEENKRALKYVVNALNLSDRFNIVQFNTDADRFRPHLVSATPENKKAAAAFIDELEAHGGTNIGDGLRIGSALLQNGAAERPAYLVLLTDGEPTVGERTIPNLIKQIPTSRNIRLFDFGIGYDVNTRLMNKLAEAHHGTSQFLEPNEDIETALSAFYQKIKSPVLTDVSIVYEGVTARNVYPKEVKDLFAGTQAVLIGRYKGGGKAQVKLSGKVNGQARSYSFPLNFAVEETGHTYLPRLWAMRRIGYLSEVAQENQENREVVSEIVDLSKRYGIISAYTSFLVTDPSEPAASLPVALPGAPMPMGVRPLRRLGSAGALPQVSMGRAVRMPGDNQVSTMMTSVSGQLMRRHSTSERRLSRAVSESSAQLFAGAYGADAGAPALDGFSAGAPAAPQKWTGRDAFAQAKAFNKLQSVSALADARDEEDSGVKTVEDKTFYKRNGFWTDSAYNEGSSAKVAVITFGTKDYFDLIRANPGISKYLAVGRQLILVFKGHCYKIVDSTRSAS